jgi:hypothetical protein
MKFLLVVIFILLAFTGCSSVKYSFMPPQPYKHIDKIFITKTKTFAISDGVWMADAAYSGEVVLKYYIPSFKIMPDAFIADDNYLYYADKKRDIHRTDGLSRQRVSIGEIEAEYLEFLHISDKYLSFYVVNFDGEKEVEGYFKLDLAKGDILVSP